MEVKIHAKTECPVPNQTLDLKITLEDVECVGDLKKKLQPVLSVAVCDMTVYYAKHIPRQKLDERERLSNLYVQEGDTFIVEFVSVCDIHSLSDILERMKAFVQEVCEHFPGTEQPTPDLNNINHIYRSVRDAFERCSYELFIPWNHKPTNANRHYFTQEGGLELLATIYNFTSTIRYPCENEDESLYCWFNEKQSQMEIYSLLCLWNFSEIKQDRQLVLKTIGLDPFIRSLLKDSSEDFNDKYLVTRINEAAVGCVAQYTELSSTQIILAENEEVLLKLLWLTSNGSDNYQKEVAANTLFCCSSHPVAATKIIKNHCYRWVLEKSQVLNEVGDDYDSLPVTSAIAYFLCLFLANIQTLPVENLLTNEERRNIDQVLETFLQLVSPTEIGEFQEEHNYVWITLSPFLQLALSGPSRPLDPGNECSSESGSQASVDSYTETGSHCHTTSRNDESCFEESYNGRRSPYSFSPAEKIGLFCLCHLVTAKENRELFRREKLVDYLICVSWFAHGCPEVVEITPNLEGFEQLEPPRLESIAKAYFLKCHGRKIV